MSADNGIYILVTTNLPMYNNEYRVIYAQAIDNIYYYEVGPLRDAEVVNYFCNGKLFDNRDMALSYAHEYAQQFDVLEYGVSEIEWNKPFPEMTQEEARRILKEEHDRVFEEESPGLYKKREGVDYSLYKEKH